MRILTQRYVRAHLPEGIMTDIFEQRYVSALQITDTFVSDSLYTVADAVSPSFLLSKP